ncbi:hypothetical protein Pmar_PMAR021958 [Perkinsus marinus ATCC 50983]|uniref:Reverse transcriptase domain-containing protein n=1 Tax=Perkinsus marinus (strain ATCC 50983 / TXsc) TaxID=423536 RepID=C5LSF1_PERM5|nr:hypothetical protein Pmar_PMAR021958 [Perkinsus marinus ATCC 50983]EER00342.1 hypothetical protein Pmar_PMAR021958 [Perkinsus marinus ATCC 50983]|eukprot:XP_002767624.1 hypothetical protein Pmar_PMAR021958 [Perkinsus marinus ATCC 50983]
MSKARPGEPMTIYKSDHAAAYRQVPTDPNEAPFQLICVKGPDGEPAIFRHLALSFGASSSVVNYCRLSQCLIHLHRVMFGAVSMSFIDDYWGIEPATSAATAYECWTVLNELLGFKEKESKKAPPSSDVRLLGLDVQLSANTLTLSLTDEKRKQLCNSLSEPRQHEEALWSIDVRLRDVPRSVVESLYESTLLMDSQRKITCLAKGKGRDR